MNSSDNDKAKAMESAENWKFVCEIDGNYTARQFGKELERLCNEHCVTSQQRCDNSSMWRYVCKKREELNCNYEMAYIIQEFKFYAKGEHSHKLGNEQQQADQKSAADAWKIKGKIPPGRKPCDNWHYLGKATSIQDVRQKYTDVKYRNPSINYAYFACERSLTAEKCTYTIRWNNKTHEVHDIREHNHGTSARSIDTTAPDKATPLAVQKDNPTSSSKAKESANKGHVDRMGRVWDFFGQVGISQSDAQIRQFGKQHGWSLNGSSAITREKAFFRCRKNYDTCPLRIVVTRKDGKAYKFADHNHGDLKEPKIGKKKPKVAKGGVKKQQKQAEKIGIEGPAEVAEADEPEDVAMEVQEEKDIITVQQNTEDPSAVEKMDATGTMEQEEEGITFGNNKNSSLGIIR